MASNYTEESLTSYNKQQLIKLFLKVQQQSNEVEGKLQDIGSEISVFKTVSSLLSDQMNIVERQCWVNVQYARRQCLEVIGLPSLVNINDLEGKVCAVF